MDIDEGIQKNNSESVQSTKEIESFALETFKEGISSGGYCEVAKVFEYFGAELRQEVPETPVAEGDSMEVNRFTSKVQGIDAQVDVNKRVLVIWLLFAEKWIENFQSH